MALRHPFKGLRRRGVVASVPYYAGELPAIWTLIDEEGCFPGSVPPDPVNGGMGQSSGRTWLEGCREAVKLLDRHHKTVAGHS